MEHYSLHSTPSPALPTHSLTHSLTPLTHSSDGVGVEHYSLHATMFAALVGAADGAEMAEKVTATLVAKVGHGLGLRFGLRLRLGLGIGFRADTRSWLGLVSGPIMAEKVTATLVAKVGQGQG